MVLEFFKGGADRTLEDIEATIVEMLVTGRHIFDLAVNTVLGGADPATVGEEIRRSDRSINKAERHIRRELVVHVSVRGHQADLPRVLVAMSVIKDAERIGDYTKNIWDLGAAGIDLSEAADIDRLLEMRDRTSGVLAQTARIYADRDGEAVHDLVPVWDEWLDEYDDCLLYQLRSGNTASDAVSRALLCRYFKRITAHSMNVITSLVMPVHRLDYYDEDKADRD
jgi:phosphate uptake regulator